MKWTACFGIAAFVCTAAFASDAATTDDPCEQGRWGHSRGWACEVREISLPARQHVDVDASPNGGVKVTGWDRNEILLVAIVRAQADTDAAAENIVDQVTIGTNGEIRANGPRRSGDDHWSVSFRLQVPKSTNLDLETVNGGIKVHDVAGDLTARATNGGIKFYEIRGTVDASTTNGGVSLDFADDGWSGSEVIAHTRNGGINAKFPRQFNGTVEASTRNGGIQSDFGDTKADRLGLRSTLRAQLGSGGPMVRLETTNGGLKLSQD